MEQVDERLQYLRDAPHAFADSHSTMLLRTMIRLRRSSLRLPVISKLRPRHSRARNRAGSPKVDYWSSGPYRGGAGIPNRAKRLSRLRDSGTVLLSDTDSARRFGLFQQA